MAAKKTSSDQGPPRPRGRARPNPKVEAARPPRAGRGTGAASRPVARGAADDVRSTDERFTGFDPAGDAFFRELARRQDREWFHAHKADYDALWVRPFTALLSEVARKIEPAYEDCELVPPKVFRIHRDVRFARDKEPYKTHIGGFVAVARAADAISRPAAFYLQLGSEEFGGAGVYVFEPASLARYRERVLDDRTGSELSTLMQKLTRAGYVAGGRELLKTPPRGIDPHHPRVELLKHKGLIVTFPAIPPDLKASAKLVDWAVKHARAAAPLVRWLAYNAY